MGSLEGELRITVKLVALFRRSSAPIFLSWLLLGLIGISFAGGIAGDMDESGRVDGYDLWLFSEARDSQQGNQNYNPIADINKDNMVNDEDLQILTDHFGFTGKGLYLWVADYANNQVVRLLLSSGAEKSRINIGSGSNPVHVSANNKDGTIWFALLTTNQVVQLSYDGRELKRISGFSAPRAIDINENTGEVWVASRGNNRVYKLLPTVPNGYNVSTQTGHHIYIAGFNYPCDLSVNSRSNVIWVADTTNDRVVRLLPGIPDAYNLASNSGYHTVKTGFNDPWAVSVNSEDGYCWIADTTNDQVVKLSPSGALEMVRKTGFNDPYDISVNPIDGTCWVADSANNRVIKLDASGNILRTVTGFLNPRAVSVDPFDGSCWVSDFNRNQIVKVIVDGSEAVRKSGFNQAYAIEVFSAVPPIGAPTAIAEVYPDRPQINQVVTFHGIGVDEDGEIIRYEWDFQGDGTYDYSSDTSGDTTYAYSANGIYNPVLRVTDSSYNTAIDYTQIVRVGAMQAYASATPVTGNAPLAVTFTASFYDPIDGKIESYQWDFDNDGFYDSYQSASTAPLTIANTYPRAGEYLAVLKVTDAGNVVSTASVAITVNKSSPTATASATPTLGIAPLTVTFTGSGTDPDGAVVLYEWDFDGDGTYDWYKLTDGNVQFTYINAGTYTARLRVTDNDGLTATATVTISAPETIMGPVPTASADPIKGNAPLTVNFYGSAVDLDGYIVFYQWDFNGDGTYDWSSVSTGNTFYVYNNPGTYFATFKVFDNSGNTATAAVSIKVLPAGYPIAIAEADPITAHVNDTINLIGEDSYDPVGTISLYEWDTNTIYFNDNVESGAGNWVASTPWARTTSTYHSATTCWTDSPGGNYANNANTALTSRVLIIPDATETLLKFWHKYATETTNDLARVEISTNGGTSWTQIASYSGTLATWTQVSLNITAYDNCQNAMIRFRLTSSASTVADGWYVDDIEITQTFNADYSSATVANTSTTFPYPGVYQAMLRVTDSNSNQDTAVVQVTIDAGPPTAVAEADPETGNAPLTTDLIGENSSDVNGSITLFEWDYNYYYFYDNLESGTYQWRVQPPWSLVRDPHGGLYSWTESPTGNYTNSLNRSITSIPFSLAVATAPQLTFWYKLALYGAAGDYCRVEISTNGGASWSQLVNYTYSNNTATWTKATVDLTTYAGQSSVMLRYRFYSDGSSVGDGWVIDDFEVSEPFFADYSSSSTPNTSYTYTLPGYYYAALRVTDDDSLTNTDIVRIRSFASPIASISSPVTSPVYKRGTISFSGTAYDPDGVIVLYEWDFNGDGTYDWSSANYGYAYSSFTTAGTWTAKFRVTDNDGFTDVEEVTFSVELKAPTISNFTASPREGNVTLSISFTVTASDSDGTIASYDWDWDGNGTFDQNTTTATTSHSYSAAGVFPVKVRVNDNEGLTAERTVTVTLKPAGYPTATAAVVPSYGYVGQVLNFNGTGSDSGGSISLYEWDFDADGTYDWSSATTGVTTYAYTAPGTYQPVLQVTDNSGNKDTDSTTVYIDYQGSIDSATYITAPGTNKVYKYTGNKKEWETGATFNNAGGLSVDPNDGSVWIANYGGSQIVKLSSTGSEIYRLTGYTNPWDVGVIHANGSVWVSMNGPNTMVLLDSTGALVRTVTGLNKPHGLDVDQSDGSVWVADYSNNRVLKINLAGTIVATITGCNTPEWVAVNQADGTCWIADTGNDLIKLRSADGLTQIMQIGGFAYPYRVAAGVDKSVWVSDRDADRIYHIAYDGTFLSSTTLTDVYGVVQNFSDLSVWVGDYANDIVYKMSAGGVIQYQAASITNPYDIDVLKGFTTADNPPTATASATPLTGDLPLTVTFTGSGTDDGTIVLYQWDFDADGVYDYSSDTSGDTSYTYTSAKIYNPIFRVIDDAGNYGFVSSIIVRPGAMTAYASASPASGNAPLSVTLNGGGTTPFGDGRLYLYEWDFQGDGIFDWSSTTTASTTNSYYSGSYAPTLRITDKVGNTKLAYAAVTVNKSNPTATITTNVSSGVSPLVVNMNANSSTDPDGSIVFWQWDYNGDGTFDYGSTSSSTVSHVYTAGTYTLTLKVTDNDGLTAQATRAITVSNSPPTVTANATPLEGNAPLDVHFIGTATDTEGPVSLYEWDFGDTVPLYDNFEAGTTQWTLTGTWGLGTTTFNSPTNCLTDSPAGNYANSQNISATSKTFSIPTGMATLRFYHKYALANADYGYVEISTNGGTNWTSLVSYTNGTVSSWTLRTIDITSYAGSANTKLRFRFTSDASTVNDGWYIDDVLITASTYTYTSPTTGETDFTYENPGLYVATFRATDNGGLTTSRTVNILVKAAGSPMATASADPTVGAAPLRVIFTGTGSDPDGTIAQYRWDFQSNGSWDYTSTTSGNTEFTYTTNGTYTALLQVTDNDGKTDTDSIVISLGYPESLPYAYPHTGIAPLTVQFVSRGWDYDGTIEYFYWDFDGNGSNDVTQRISTTESYTYSSPGVYYAKLTVVDNSGLSASATIPITVTQSGAPTAYAQATPSSGLAPLTVNFTGYGIDPDGTLAIFEWDFESDGVYDYNSAINGNTTYQYLTEGDYKATFRVTDNNALSGETYIYINVNPSGSPTAIASASPASGSSPLTVTFTGTGTDEDGTISKYEWDFDDDGIYDYISSTTGSTFYVYQTPGRHTAVLRVTDDDNLTDTARLTINVSMGISARRSDEAFDPTIGQTASVITSTTASTTISIRMINRDVELVRTLVDHEYREAGVYIDVWDGKDDEGNFVTSGTYFFIVDYVVDGIEYHYDLTSSAGSQIFPTVSYSSTFSPLEDNYLTATFTLTSPAEITTYISPFTTGAGNRIRTINCRKPYKSGPKVMVWDGTKDDGTLASLGSNYVIAVMMWALSNNAIIVASDPVVANINCEPNFYNPKNPYQEEPNAYCRYNYTITKQANLTVSIRNSTNYLVREVSIPNVQPGENIAYWDAIGYTTKLMYAEIYQVRFEAVDNFGNESDRIHGIMKIFY